MLDELILLAGTFNCTLSKPLDFEIYLTNVEYPTGPSLQVGCLGSFSKMDFSDFSSRVVNVHAKLRLVSNPLSVVAGCC
jgi:hypothetical protein